MKRWLLTTVLTLVPLGAGAQDIGSLRVEGPDEPVTVAAARHRAYAAFPAWTLRTLGASVDGGTRGTVVILFHDTLAFEAASPFFTVRGRAVQLVHPAYREGGVLYLPHQFFAEWLPARYRGLIDYSDGTLRLVREPAARGVAGGSNGEPAATNGRRAARRPAPAQRLVVLDPGHGGVDPGRPGPDGLLEKDLALAFSKRLARELERRGYEVRLTRTTDTLIALDDRPHMANEWKGNRPAAVFMSIHMNGVNDRRVRGYETFFLSDARTDDERRVAEMENAAIAYETERAVPAEGLDFIIKNLRNDFYIHASHSFAGTIQSTFGEFHPGPDRGVKQAGFRVLVGAVMPAVLVEIGFITNRSEAGLLDSARFQQRVAQGLADSVDRFFATHEHLWADVGS